MPNFHDLLKETQTGNTYDITRRKYLEALANYTGRNVIAYYSGWLQKSSLGGEAGINDADMNGFMTVIHKLENRREKGLDLILHTPGGELAATESIVKYLRSIFGTNIRAIVPQLAMSAGTMIACACNEIMLGKHSSLGPIDPQINNIPTHGVIEEFKEAMDEVKKNPSSFPIWQTIIAKYSPTFVGECKKTIEWSVEMVTDWLESGMFKDKQPPKKISEIVKGMADHALTKFHNRHLSFDDCKEIGLNVTPLESKHELQDAVLSVHHAFILTFEHTNAAKITENQQGTASVRFAPQIPQLDQILNMR